MSYYRCSGNFFSCSLGDHLRYSGSSYGSSYPSNLVYSTDRCSPSSCHLGSSLYTGCQETCCDPIRCQTFHVVSSPCQMSCYHRRTSTFFIPCQTTYSVLWASGLWLQVTFNLLIVASLLWALDPVVSNQWVVAPMLSHP
ncbi:hypothetical protein E2I00_014236 [Balaenoptera physalus]|uniref:Keratin-associated protein n=1 Tax=Balaenoptera physalus TaxID=9770 RepID=A0A6A1QCV2_BALPH|nr:hypothetical protein E2I00_014236 [Balaenoptera physalus]